jgi:hypothetical protein
VRKKDHVVATRIFLSAFLLFTFNISTYDAAANGTHHHAGGGCSGFVVLPNGYAVLSHMATTHTQAKSHTHPGATPDTTPMPHKMGSQTVPKDKQMMHKDHAHAGEMSKPSAAQQHLMGYQHGQMITLQKGMLCVPFGSKDETTWTAVSHTASLYVRAESLRGPLAHNSRANESFALTVIQRDADTCRAMTATCQGATGSPMILTCKA